MKTVLIVLSILTVLGVVSILDGLLIYSVCALAAVS